MTLDHSLWSQEVIVKVSLWNKDLVDEVKIDALSDIKANASPEDKDHGDDWNVEVSHLFKIFWRHLLELMPKIIQELVNLFLILSIVLSVVHSVFLDERVIDFISNFSESFEHIDWFIFLFKGGWNCFVHCWFWDSFSSIPFTFS
jgi:hypothetical protein